MDDSSIGSKQAYRAWFQKLSVRLRDLGFKNSKAHTSTLYHLSCGHKHIVLVYVDDIIIISSDKDSLKNSMGCLIKALHGRN